MIDRAFKDVAQDLQHIACRLNATMDPQLRYLLLRDMKLLLVEADQILLARAPQPQVRPAAPSPK